MKRPRRALRDFEPACTLRLFVGAGIGRYSQPGRRLTIDPEQHAQRVRAITERFFTGATHVRARGFWEGVGEPTIVVEAIEPTATCGDLERRGRCAAAALTRALDQDAVAVLSRHPDGKARVDFVKRDAKIAACRTLRSVPQVAGARRRR
jgi:hypothetical protein